MGDAPSGVRGLPARACHRAIEARDPRFDGRFFVGITSTKIYCRPICPSRPADPANRRFFPTAAEAESAAFRPCLRCRPELAPGRALVDAVSRLASSAAERIAAGALNGRSVGRLASDLHVSERHLRRALKRELGISPTELAQSHRLLTAKRLLGDTDLDISRIAYASGFQSLRRFNAVIKERYGMTPSELRRSSARRTGGRSPGEGPEATVPKSIELTLAYRPPYDWRQVLAALDRHGIPGTWEVHDGRYVRAVRLDGQSGLVVARDEPAGNQLHVEISTTLLPQLMALLAGLRRLFDLDAEPSVIDDHLARAGLETEVATLPGVRVPGPFDGFQEALAALLPAEGIDRSSAVEALEALGSPLEQTWAGVGWTLPDPDTLVDAGADGLGALGMPAPSASRIAGLARAVTDGALSLDTDSEVATMRRALLAVEGIDPRAADRITARATHRPDTLDAWDPELLTATDTRTSEELLHMARKWRPWRAYAAELLRQRAGRHREGRP